MNIYIGENIKRLRHERGITQEELAEHMNVSSPAVSKWERGETLPDITMLFPLANYFGVSLDELMGYDAERTASEIQKIIREYNKLHLNGRYDEANNLICEARKIYPNDYNIMCYYMWCVSGSRNTVNEEKLNEHSIELYKICDAILNGCTIEHVRLEAISMKAKLEQTAGRTESALAILSDFPTLLQTREQKSEDLFTRGEPEYLEWNRRNLYQLAEQLGFKLVRSVWFDNEVEISERIQRIEACGEAFTELGEKFNEKAFCMIERSVFSHLKLQLTLSNGSFDDILRITEKELNALAKVCSVFEKNMLKQTVDHYKTAQQPKYAELRTHPEFMTLLEKYS